MKQDSGVLLYQGRPTIACTHSASLIAQSAMVIMQLTEGQVQFCKSAYTHVGLVRVACGSNIHALALTYPV